MDFCFWSKRKKSIVELFELDSSWNILGIVVMIVSIGLLITLQKKTVKKEVAFSTIGITLFADGVELQNYPVYNISKFSFKRNESLFYERSYEISVVVDSNPLTLIIDGKGIGIGPLLEFKDQLLV